MYVLTYIHNGQEFYLRSTVWTSVLDRATRYATEQEARDALAKRHRIVGGMGHPKRALTAERETAKLEEVEA